MTGREDLFGFKEKPTVRMRTSSTDARLCGVRFWGDETLKARCDRAFRTFSRMAFQGANITASYDQKASYRATLKFVITGNLGPPPPCLWKKERFTVKRGFTSRTGLPGKPASESNPPFRLQERVPRPPPFFLLPHPRTTPRASASCRGPPHTFLSR